MNVKRSKILVVDDDPMWLESLPIVLKGMGDIDTQETVDGGLSAISSRFYDVAILDLNFACEKRTGLDLFHAICAANKEVDVILLTGEQDSKRLCETFNAGICRFLSKMTGLLEIRTAVEKALYERALRTRTRNQLATGRGLALCGDSPQMNNVRRQIASVIERKITDVLVLGETGTGKELVAQSIAAGGTPGSPLIVVECSGVHGGIAESEFFGHVRGAFTGADRDKIGVFEAANGGFVFLDEIGELPLGQQAKLLRVLQERKVRPVGSHKERPANFRCITATHVNLEKAVKEGNFREDLYYRIAKEEIRIPPLRERTEDIPELVQHFLTTASGEKNPTITSEATALLQQYRWPGNIRQLKSVLERLLSSASGGAIRESHVYQALPDLVANRISLAERFPLQARILARPSERERFEKAMVKCMGDRTAAAVELGISRATFYRRAKDFGMLGGKN